MQTDKELEASSWYSRYSLHLLNEVQRWKVRGLWFEIDHLVSTFLAAFLESNSSFEGRFVYTWLGENFPPRMNSVLLQSVPYRNLGKRKSLEVLPSFPPGPWGSPAILKNIFLGNIESCDAFLNALSASKLSEIQELDINPWYVSRNQISRFKSLLIRIFAEMSQQKRFYIYCSVPSKVLPLDALLGSQKNTPVFACLWVKNLYT